LINWYFNMSNGIILAIDIQDPHLGCIGTMKSYLLCISRTVAYVVIRMKTLTIDLKLDFLYSRSNNPIRKTESTPFKEEEPSLFEKI
jgi:hypothetical protein